jgi:hypothetical protein
MKFLIPGLRATVCEAVLLRPGALACGLALFISACASSAGQAPTPGSPPALSPAPAPSTAGQASEQGITGDEIRQMLLGKTLYLRDGFLDNTLSFNEHGALIGHSPRGSYTLSLIEIDKVDLTKHKLELTGVRYGLHFLGARADEDSTKAFDKVRITPKKKFVKITIDRELVVIPKKKKHGASTPPPQPEENAATEASAAEPTAASGAETAPEQSGQAAAVTTTTSPAHAARLLRDAIDRIFAQSLDERMLAAMPDFWRLYYEAAARQSDYRPSDPAILRQNTVDEKARLLTPTEPPSNEYAQACAVAGMALYHVVLGADGKPQQIVVGRPIGFGLDENAADTILKASFQPAMKGGKPVPVMLDVVMQFRIYSKRTDRPAAPDANTAAQSKLPGPYSTAQP